MSYEPIEHDDDRSVPLHADDHFARGMAWGVLFSSALWIAIGLLGVLVWSMLGRP